MKTKKYFITPIKQLTGEPFVNITDDRLYRLNFSYLHGNIENKAGYDIYCFIDEKPETEGIFDIICLFPDEEIECKGFIWQALMGAKGLQGLIVAKNDLKYIKDAKEKYNKKEYCI